MKQAQESEQLSSSRSQSQRNFKIESTITEQALIVRVLSDVSQYEGTVDKKQFTDGSLIAKNFDTLEDIQ